MINNKMLGCDVGEYQDIPDDAPVGSVIKMTDTRYYKSPSGYWISEHYLKAPGKFTRPVTLDQNYVPGGCGLFYPDNPRHPGIPDNGLLRKLVNPFLVRFGFGTR